MGILQLSRFVGLDAIGPQPWPILFLSSGCMYAGEWNKLKPQASDRTPSAMVVCDAVANDEEGDDASHAGDRGISQLYDRRERIFDKCDCNAYDELG